MADNFDKFRPDWTVGTLTLTGGSTAFTATNAELILAAIREGDAIITPSGFFLPIETLAEDGLSGTLSNPAPATAAGTFDTRIRYQSDNSRFTGALLALTRQLTGGNLQSFGNLQGLQDLMPIFLGPGSVGLINKSELGLQDPNGTLAAIVAAQGIPNNQLPARIREATSVITDANLATASGWNVIGGDGANIPVPLAGFVFTIAQSTNLLTQIWYQRAGYRSFMRFCSNGTWGSWAERASTASAAALALLQLTGAANALPYFTGAGSSATTTLSPFARTVIDDASGAAMFATMGATQSLGGGVGYSKGPNGKLEQWGTTIVTPSSSGFGSITFPMTFSNTNWVAIAMNGDHLTSPYMKIITNRQSLAANRYDFRAIDLSNNTAITTPVRIDWQAEGN